MNEKSTQPIESTQKYNTKETDTIHRLYFTDEHVLGNEVCEILGIHIANISNIKSDKILKVGNCPILSKYDLSITKKIRNTMFSNNITSLKNKMSLSYFKSEYNMTDSEILSTIATEIQTIAGKKFIKYTDDFINKIKQPNNIDNLIYVCNLNEFKELQNEEVPKYHYKITDKKYLIIY